MTVQYIFRLEDPSFDDSYSLPKQKQQEIWRVKEIKRIVDCSLPQAKAIHDAIAAGEFHKVDGVALSRLIDDFIIELPGTRTTGPDDADVQQYQFVDGYKSNQAFAINGTIGCPSKYTLAVIDAIDKSQASTVPKPILQSLLDRGVIVPRTAAAI